MGLDPEMRAEVDAVFRGDAPARLDRLEGALARLAIGGGEPDRAAAAFEAHSLRGAAAIVGRTELADLCAEVQGAVDGERADSTVLAELAARVRRMRDAILAGDHP